jgi:hypothetical protein
MERMHRGEDLPESPNEFDDTPVLDIKPYMAEFGPRGDVIQPQWSHELMQAYWTEGAPPDHHRTPDPVAWLDEVRRSPADHGVLAMIVRRPATNEREVLAVGELDFIAGLVGDNWLARGSRSSVDGSAELDAQLNIMNIRCARLVAGGDERVALAGDQLFVDLDLSPSNLPAGTQLRIGTAVIDVSGVTVPTSVVNGSLVRIKMSTTLNGSGQYVATQVRAGRGNPENIAYSEIEGTVTAYTSNSAFSVDGIVVNATSATFEDAASLALGARVEVKGSIVSGQFVATKVEVKTETEQENEGFELEGRITSVNTTAQTFVLRGVTVSYAGAVDYERGNASQLIANAKVEVDGVLAIDGTTINATKIKFED